MLCYEAPPWTRRFVKVSNQIRMPALQAMLMPMLANHGHQISLRGFNCYGATEQSRKYPPKG